MINLSTVLLVIFVFCYPHVSSFDHVIGVKNDVGIAIDAKVDVDADIKAGTSLEVDTDLKQKFHPSAGKGIVYTAGNRVKVAHDIDLDMQGNVGAKAKLSSSNELSLGFRSAPLYPLPKYKSRRESYAMQQRKNHDRGYATRISNEDEEYLKSRSNRAKDQGESHRYRSNQLRGPSVNQEMKYNSYRRVGYQQREKDRQLQARVDAETSGFDRGSTKESIKQVSGPFPYGLRRKRAITKSFARGDRDQNNHLKRQYDREHNTKSNGLYYQSGIANRNNQQAYERHRLGSRMDKEIDSKVRLKNKFGNHLAQTMHTGHKSSIRIVNGHH
jgi:hypothetical protein